MSRVLATPECSLSTSDASSVASGGRYSSRLSHRIKKKEKGESPDLNAHYLRELKRLEHKGPLTEAETRAILVRVRNRVSAQKSRTKQRERFAVISEENAHLRAKIEALEAENRQLEGAICLRPQAAEPEVLELRHENSALREALKQRISNENALRERLKEAADGGKVFRTGVEGLRGGGTKAFAFLAGLMLLSLLFIGQSQYQGVKTMGFDFAPKKLRTSPSGEALSGWQVEGLRGSPEGGAQLQATFAAFDALKKNREREKISERFRKLKEVKAILNQRV